MLQPFRITPVHDRLLRSLASLQLLTAEQLCRLHYSPRSLTYVKAQLKSLSDHGYVLSDAIPTRRYRSPYYYLLAPKGARYLASTGLDVPFSKEADRHALFIYHSLELNDVLISALLLQPPYRLASFTHERVLKRTPIKLERYTLIPDAFLDFRREEKRKAVLLEHDRGTEGESHFKRKVRAYQALLSSGAYQEAFQVRAVTVAVTTTSDIRCLQLRQWAHDECDRLWFASLSFPPEPNVWLDSIWRTPTSDYQPLL